jgi:predicted enzyme related to lactoylglutathione lyase
MLEAAVIKTTTKFVARRKRRRRAMSEHAGKFVWYEWMGADPERAAKFYGEVLGWSVMETGMAGFPYWIASAGPHGVGGLFATPKEAQGAPPCWSGYIAVDDVDAAAKKLAAGGGKVMRPAFDIPNVGRAALVADSQGVPFLLFQPNPGGPPPPEPMDATPGLVGWRELHALDGKAALDFYAAQFGWREDRQHDMGPMGVYHIFDAGGQQGGMMTRFAQGPGPCWLYYINVDAADAANARVTAMGGKILNGPHEVPGGLFVTQCADPEGAMFGLSAPKR